MSLGGESKSEQSMPPWLEAASQDALAQAQEVADIGYVPHYGPDVAALNDAQIGAMQNTANMASSYGLSVPEVSVPAPQTFAGGIEGYSSAPLFEQSVDAFAAERPGQYDAIMSQFIDPFTGMAYGQEAITGENSYYLPTPLSALTGDPFNRGVVVDPMGNLVYSDTGLPVHSGGRGR